MNFPQNFSKHSYKNLYKVSKKFYRQTFHILWLSKISKFVQNVCSASIYNKSFKYFFNNFHTSLNFSQISRKSSQSLLEIPLIPFQNISKFFSIFSTNFTIETSKLFYLKILQIYDGCLKSKFPHFFPRRFVNRSIWNWRDI